MSFIPKTYTVESVTSGHPDKVCDQISDAILDACLAQDSMSRVAVESFGGHGLLIVGGEITSNAKVDYEALARKVYKDIGYDQELKVVVNIAKQSQNISDGVDTGGAGDQGMMYGYATDETLEFMPSAIVKVHALAKGLEDLRKSGEISWIKPDGKTQITVCDGVIKTVLISTQHDENVTQEEIKKVLTEKLIRPIIGDISGIEILVNPSNGKFVQGGFEADTGLTGRKIMVDTYCGMITHGGGAFSGKDPTKVDRSGAYMARFVAKNLVAAGYAKECLVSVAYAIGMAEPLMVEATNEKGEDLSEIAKAKFDFKPKAIIEKLDLRKPIYQKTAAYGHFGKAGLPWEQVIDIK
jgi:S-adenosylmethionine synthetase